MKYLPIDKDLFIQNRKRFTERLKPNSLAIFWSNDQMPRTGDQYFEFVQNRDFFHLSGIDQEESILVLYPDAPKAEWREILFVKETSDEIRIWEGDKYTKEQATETSGIQTVHWLQSFETLFATLMNYVEHVYLDLNENDRFASPVPYMGLRKARELKEAYPAHEYERSAPIMRDLRIKKSQTEIDLIQQGCNITKKAFERVLEFVKPGVYEFEIEAEIIHEFTRNRANGFAYHPIIASGANACALHYEKNNEECKDGDVILFDFGAEYANYSSDMSRAIPVNGKFTKRQKEVYNAVLRVFKQAKDLLRPGAVIDEYHVEVGKLMEKELVHLKLLTMDEVRKNPAGKSGTNDAHAAYKKYFMHGTSHHLGLDTHDFGSRYQPLEPGMVLTCEPGIYIREEGLGVRLENDLVVTEGAPKDLMADIPIEAEDIEERMNR